MRIAGGRRTGVEGERDTVREKEKSRLRFLHRDHRQTRGFRRLKDGIKAGGQLPANVSQATASTPP